MRKTVIIVFLLAVLIVIGFFIYFVAGVSSTYPPIKKYEYAGTINQLTTNIRNYASVNSDVSFKITDKVGSPQNGYATYGTIKTKGHGSDIEYSIKCEESNSGNLIKTTISLVEAYDITRNVGGYSKEAKGIEPLVNNFDVNFLTPLRNSQNIKITPL